MKIVEEAMSLSSENPVLGIRFYLLPSPKEMMRMDSICFNSPWNEQDYREMQEQPSFNNWLLEIPAVGQVGMLVFQSVPPELEILRLGVLPSWRRNGLAVFMLEQLEIQMESDSLETLWLEVHAANKTATSLYCRLGYKEISIRKNYFRNPLGDALLLKKILN